MATRAFPIVYAQDVTRSVAFYQRLGFERVFQLPPEGEPGYVGLRRGQSELAVVASAWPLDRYGLRAGGEGVRFEMYVYVDDVDAAVAELRDAAVPVLREPADMPWGERVGFVVDPDGNPIALSAAAAGAS